MTQVRPIPGAPNQFVITGVPHYPQNAVGTVIRLDMTRPIRTREPITYMTPDVDIRRTPWAVSTSRFPSTQSGRSY